MSTSRIFIKGLPPNITEAEFRKHFSAGNREITDVKLIPQRRIGYVGYKSAHDAAGAVKYFNRSYIRMSRISVETARPISDPASRKGHSGSCNLGAPEEHTAPRSASDHDVNTKKRKREEQETADPRLREFLQVMRSGREGAVADDSNAAVGADHAFSHGEVAVPEGESDDEYEQIPSRTEKSRRIEPRQDKSDNVARQPPPRDERTPKDNIKEAGENKAEAIDSEMTDQGPSATGATDDDWLRSRTNRLLDLVDPDDLASGAVLNPVDATTEQDMENDRLSSHSSDEGTPGTTTDVATSKETATEDAVSAISRTSRLFVRNLPYSATEDDIRETFDKFGTLQEVHLPLTAAGATKGFAMVLFTNSSDAVRAFQALDGVTFQGRILHIIPADAKREQGLDEFGISKMPLKKQNMIRKKAEAASSSFNWNSLYMSQDAVNASIASRLGVSKSELLDPTSADAAIKQAIAETTVIQETKAYFAANGVDLDAFKSQRRGDTTILVKNFPFGTTMQELRKMFEEHGQVLRVLMPPTGTIAIVQFAQANHAKAAFGKLAYRRIKDSVLFLEKAPKDLLRGDISEQTSRATDQQATGVQKFTVSDLLSSGDKAEEVETTSLFIRNLNFATTTSRLAEAFESLDGFVSARVKTKMDPKKPGQTLSMGFGFAEFRSKTQAQAALKALDGHVLDGHTLGVKASHKGQDAAEERRREDRAKKAAAQRTKIVIKNLPFQATKKDVRSLFGTYGQLRSVRVPKKADFTARGFAFADFVTPREAENALNALKDTHLLGRRLVLDFAEAEAVDAEEEIEKMQRKVGGQVNKVALQRLTGGGRKRVTIGNDEEEFDT
ncbi:Multiple RNA-binding domain-containing protein [Metarhizium anisopliae BRIP 53293]|uniref:Multiple RNA-binding domain-containing protein 1 n=1 Tax=Metarhizium anisopliae BRIP 53293 TaxID=1291518 RepID=A0A0D9P0T3_METAN|nr:Multiple RNA-binding domain-containing protein [Metarhizium anisopliae BRIP 53293]KJK93742.1 Multiple RNA-binding domain-containing protein [Metarhizium anisopliae BRIP 53284]